MLPRPVVLVVFILAHHLTLMHIDWIDWHMTRHQVASILLPSVWQLWSIARATDLLPR